MSSYYEKMLATGEVKCIDEEVPFEIPKGWEWCRFSSLYLSLTDGTHSTPKYTLAGIPFISVKDISSGIIDFSNTKYISKEEHQKLSDRCHPQKGDLLLSKVGTTGIPALVTIDKEFSLFVSVALIKLTQNKFSNEFLVFMIQSPLVQEQAKENTRGVGNKNWVLSAVSKTLMVVPPLEEQERIKNRLNLVLPYIERYSSSQDKLDLLNINIVTYLKKSILQEAIKGKLVPQIAEEGTAQELLEQIKTEKQELVKEGKLKKSALNDSVIFRGDDNKYYEQIGSEVTEIELSFDFPNTWSIARLNAVCQLTDGLKTIGKQCLLDAKYLRGKSSETIVEQGKLVYKGDNIMLVDGGNSGEVSIAPQDGYMGSTFKQLWISSSMYEPYVLAFIQFYKETLRNSKKGAAIPHLNKELFYGLIIGIPPLQEQRRVVQKIEQSTQLLK